MGIDRPAGWRQAARAAVHAGPLSWFAAALLGLLIGGCGSTGPAPVDGWDWKGPVPDGYYLVRKGDTLAEIAQRRGVRFRTLAQWNGLKSPYTIYAGRLLRIQPPDGSPVPRRGYVARTGSKSGKSAARASRSGGAKSAPAVQSAAPGSRRAASGVAWDWPLDGRLLQGFLQGDRTHQGIRIGGRAGEQVRAAAEGKVVYSGSGLKGYGNLIIVKHNKKYLSAYGFNRRLYVKEGDNVSRGQAIAEVGQGAEGAYLLHFEVRRDGTAVDPILYLPRRK